MNLEYFDTGGISAYRYGMVLKKGPAPRYQKRVVSTKEHTLTTFRSYDDFERDSKRMQDVLKEMYGFRENSLPFTDLGALQAAEAPCIAKFATDTNSHLVLKIVFKSQAERTKFHLAI
jgi:hypothetical protein